jgi:hypothetical protein
MAAAQCYWSSIASSVDWQVLPPASVDVFNHRLRPMPIPMFLTDDDRQLLPANNDDQRQPTPPDGNR